MYATNCYLTGLRHLMIFSDKMMPDKMMSPQKLKDEMIHEMDEMHKAIMEKKKSKPSKAPSGLPPWLASLQSDLNPNNSNKPKGAFSGSFTQTFLTMLYYK